VAEEKNLSCTEVSLVWSTGVHNRKQLDSAEHMRYKAAIVKPGMQQAIYISEKDRNVPLSEYTVAERHLK